jgi:hypothetical protein
LIVECHIGTPQVNLCFRLVVGCGAWLKQQFVIVVAMQQIAIEENPGRIRRPGLFNR